MAKETSRAEACRLLGVSPSTFRRLLEDYRDLLPGDAAHLNSETLRRLKLIERMRAKGLEAEAIGQALKEMADGPAAEEETKVEMATSIATLKQELHAAEERRVADRDQLLTALMRTQQEVTHLRYELVAHASRRDRRRRGLLGLFH